MRKIHRNTTTYLFRVVLAVTVVLAVVACDSTGTTADDTTGDSIEYVIRSDGSTAYRFEGPDVDSNEQNPTITLQRGKTYAFDNTTGSTHPFFIKSDNSTGSGNALGADDGVTGSSTGTTTFAVPANAPDQLFYICSLHSTMAGEFTVVD